MYNENIQKSSIADLEQRRLNIVKVNVALADQGYVVNAAKRTRLEWSSILLDAFQNIHVFDKEQQEEIERLYYNLLEL